MKKFYLLFCLVISIAEIKAQCPVTITPGSSNICVGNSTTLTGSGATNTYTWTPAIGLSSTTGSTVTANPATTITYTLYGTSGGCTDSTSITVYVSQNPTVTISGTPSSICAGQTATLTALGAMTYTWAPGGNTSSIFYANPTSTTNYTVCGSTVNGCVSCTTVSIGVVPTPTLTITGNTTICNGNSTILTASGATNYTWQPGGFFLGSYTVTPGATGTYTVIGDNGGCVTMDAVTVFVQDSCVWPGDADEDLTVTNNDLLPIGLKFAATGPARSTQSTLWNGYSCNNWTDTLANGTNIKYVDCNGDGTINNNDTLAIYANFNSTHPAKLALPNTIYTSNPDMYLQYNKNIYSPGDTVLADVYIGSNTNQQTNFYGAAFTIDYDENVVVSGSEKYFYNNSWVGTINTDMLKFGNINSSLGIIDASLVRTNHNNASGFGKIARLSFILKNTLSTNQLHFTIQNTTKTDNAGLTGILNAGTDSVTLIPGTTSVKQITEKQLQIYPNPAKDIINISLRQMPVENAILLMTDMLGNTVKQVAIYNSSFTINVSDLTNGVYFVKIKSGETTFIKKIIVNR